MCCKQNSGNVGYLEMGVLLEHQAERLEERGDDGKHNSKRDIAGILRAEAPTPAPADPGRFAAVHLGGREGLWPLQRPDSRPSLMGALLVQKFVGFC